MKKKFVFWKDRVKTKFSVTKRWVEPSLNIECGLIEKEFVILYLFVFIIAFDKCE